MEPTIERLNSQAQRIKLYVDKTLSNKFRIPVKIDDDVARVIAMATIFKDGDGEVWLNGSPQSLKSLHLELKLISPPKATKT